MENKKNYVRVCNFCGSRFELTKNQRRQVKEKWATHCSRSCARKNQHARNYKTIRAWKKCDQCNKNFRVSNWDKERAFCSNKCAATARFGEKDKSKTLAKLQQIFKDEKYLNYLKGLSKKIAFKYHRDEHFAEDILQEYFLKLSEGCNTLLEHVAKSMIRKELKKGVVGKWDSDFTFNSVEVLGHIRHMKSDLDSIEFKEYILDLFCALNEFERKFIMLYIKGFTDVEVMQEIRKRYPIGNQKFYSEKRRIFKTVSDR